MIVESPDVTVLADEAQPPSAEAAVSAEKEESCGGKDVYRSS